MRWIDWIKMALERLGGEASLARIYAELLEIRPEPFGPTWTATVRRTIQSHSLDSITWDGTLPAFYSVDGIGSGVWGLV